VANDAVALIIAPGAAFTVQAAAGCTARSQTHPPRRARSTCATTSSAKTRLGPTPDANFVTTGPSGSFNDQVLRVTTADLLPEIEAAIAVRIQREIVPLLRLFTQIPYLPQIRVGDRISATNPLFPYPAPFANPGPGVGTSDFRGVAGTSQGLLPFNQTQGCPVSAPTRAGLPSPLLVDWSSGTPPDVIKIGGFGTFRGTPACSWQSGGNDAYCEGSMRKTARIHRGLEWSYR